MGTTYNFPPMVPLIVPDQNVTVSAIECGCCKVVESVSWNTGTTGGVYLQTLRRSSQ